MPVPSSPDAVAASAADEQRHAPTDELLWSESWYLDFFDPAQGIGGYVRLGLYPGMRTAWYWACVVGPDRPLATVIDHEVARSEAATGFRNAALANFMRSFDRLIHPVDHVLGVYFHQCAIAMSCRQLARAGLFLAAGGTNPLTGHRVPDADLATDRGPVRLSALFGTGHAVLLDLAGAVPDGHRLPDRVDLVRATCPEDLGAGALLIRPDGYVCWACDGSAAPGGALPAGLTDALGTIARIPAPAVPHAG